MGRTRQIIVSETSANLNDPVNPADPHGLFVVMVSHRGVKLHSPLSDRQRDPNAHEPVGLAIGERLEENGVEDGEVSGRSRLACQIASE